jgi:hypothetical protein
LNGTTLLKKINEERRKEKDFNLYVRNKTLYLQAQNSMHITCQSIVNLSIKTAFTKKDIAQFLQVIFIRNIVLKTSTGMFYKYKYSFLTVFKNENDLWKNLSMYSVVRAPLVLCSLPLFTYALSYMSPLAYVRQHLLIYVHRIVGFHDSEDPRYSLLGYDAV